MLSLISILSLVHILINRNFKGGTVVCLIPMSLTLVFLIKRFDCTSHYTLMNGGIETTLMSFQALNIIGNALASTNNTYIRTAQLSTKFRRHEPIPRTFQQRQSWTLYHWATPPHRLLHSVKNGFSKHIALLPSLNITRYWLSIKALFSWIES